MSGSDARTSRQSCLPRIDSLGRYRTPPGALPFVSQTPGNAWPGARQAVPSGRPLGGQGSVASLGTADRSVDDFEAFDPARRIGHRIYILAG